MAELVLQKPKSRKKRTDVQAVVSSTYGALRRPIGDVAHIYLHGPRTKKLRDLGEHVGTLHLGRYEIRALLESLHETQSPRELQKLLDQARRAHERKVKRRGFR